MWFLEVPTIQNCFLNYAPEEYVNLQLDEDLDD
jgi:hypothetical protein